MYVCLCNNITDRQIRSAAETGASSLADLSHRFGLATRCGSCAAMAQEVLETHLADRQAAADSGPPID